MCVSASEASNSSCILVVEPHPTLRMVLAQRLRQDGHMTAAVASAAEAMQLCLDQQPDLLVSAELLEETTALKLGAQLRCPVMVLTARTGAEAVVSLLDSGAEDVLRKPFGLEEMAARCRKLLTRSGGLQEQVTVGPLSVHLLLRQVTLRDQPVELSPREFALLCALLMPPAMCAAAKSCSPWPGLPLVVGLGLWIRKCSPCAASWNRPALAKAAGLKRCASRAIASASTTCRNAL